jgi:GAF domain-containing protein
VYTDADSPAIDEAQYRDGKGPCLDSWRDNTVLKVPRVEDWADEYPGFATGCLERGIHSTLSLPMVAGDVAVGAMNLYSRVHDGFSDDDEAVGLDLAAAGSALLANVSAYWTAFELSQHLNEALKSRAVIEQAKGMLMARTPGLSAQGAFDLLRRASQRENVKLRDLAARIVEGRVGLTGDEGDRS